MHWFFQSPALKAVDLGTLPMGEEHLMHVSLQNANPISVNLLEWHTTLPKATIELVSINGKNASSHKHVSQVFFQTIYPDP